MHVLALREYPSLCFVIMMLDSIVLENVEYFNLLVLLQDETDKY